MFMAKPFLLHFTVFDGALCAKKYPSEQAQGDDHALNPEGIGSLPMFSMSFALPFLTF